MLENKIIRTPITEDKTKDLKVDSAIKGDYTKDKVSLLYLESKVNKVSLNKIKTYPNDIKIYPGHGESSDLDYEKKYNMFLS